MRLLFAAIATNNVAMAIKSGIIDSMTQTVLFPAVTTGSYTKRLILREVFSLEALF